MPVNQALIYLVTAANAYSNIFLYRFLVNLTANNTAINETDKEVLKNKFVKLNWLAERDHFRKSTSSNQTKLNHTKPNSSIPN